MIKFARQLNDISLKLKIFDSNNRFFRDLRISVTDKCNFKCIYCMPNDDIKHQYKSLKHDKILSFEEISKIVTIISTLGLKKIRFTGGEPLLRKNISKLIELIRKKNNNIQLSLTTNGAFLSKYADKLKNSGLNNITVSLPSLNENTFKKLTGNIGSVKSVLNGIKTAEKFGFEKIKINVTILKGKNDSSILDIINYFMGTKHIVRFIEFMDVGSCNNWKLSNVLTSEEIKRIIKKKYSLKELKENYHSEVAKRFSCNNGKLEIGFISSISEPFCKNCSRLRLSSDGKLYTCLFSSIPHDLKAKIRRYDSDIEIKNWIISIWKKRNDQYSNLRLNDGNKKIKQLEMYQIGG